MENIKILFSRLANLILNASQITSNLYQCSSEPKFKGNVFIYFLYAVAGKGLIMLFIIWYIYKNIYYMGIYLFFYSIFSYNNMKDMINNNSKEYKVKNNIVNKDIVDNYFTYKYILGSILSFIFITYIIKFI